MNIDFQHHSTLSSAIFGFGGAVLGKTVFLVEQASSFDLSVIISTFLLGMIGALGGIVLNSIYKWLRVNIKTIFSNLAKRWEAEESSLGKNIKYYVGYIGIASGTLAEIFSQISALYTGASLPIPAYITHGLVLFGIVAYVGAKLTKKEQPKP